MAADYTYAVARIRAKELQLLGKQELNALLACKDDQQCLRLLADKGWGKEEQAQSAEDLLQEEQKKIWLLMRELVDDVHVFDVFLVQSDFHNLKASVKAITRSMDPSGIFLPYGTVPAQHIYESVGKRAYAELPHALQDCAKEAMTLLLQTGDGQLCDSVIDKACLQTVRALGMQAENEVLSLYAELTVAFADIKIAVRCCKTGKTPAFIQNSLAACETLNTQLLAKAASKSMEDLYAYLRFTDYAAAVEALKQSPAAFEKWCDDLLMHQLQTQKWEPFSIGPLAAYIVARETEIRAVRLILSAKRNGLDLQIVKERLRDMYV